MKLNVLYFLLEPLCNVNTPGYNSLYLEFLMNYYYDIPLQNYYNGIASTGISVTKPCNH